MSSSALRSFRDGFHLEDLDLCVSLCTDLIPIIKSYTRQNVPIPSDLASNATIEERAREAERVLQVMLLTINQELTALASVQNLFFKSFGKALRVDPNWMSLAGVNSESIAQLSEEECRQALSIAVKTIADAIKMNQIRWSQANAHLKLYELRRTQRRQWDKKANELALKVDQLQAEAEAREQETKEMASSVKNCSKRLKSLLSISQSVGKGKQRAQVASLDHSVTAVEKLFTAEREEVNLLERRLAEAEKELAVARTSLVDSAADIETLRNQLSVATQHGHMHAARAEELEEKLRCSICMDRPKNVAFACGHACCDQCASDWKQCSLNCKGPKSQKPVKHTFTLYL